MFGFHGHELGIQASIGHQFRQVLHDMGLRGDGVGGHHVHIGHLDGIGRSDGYFDTNSFSHYSSSATMLMHPVKHSWAQMPQPLQ